MVCLKQGHKNQEHLRSNNLVKIILFLRVPFLVGLLLKIPKIATKTRFFVFLESVLFLVVCRMLLATKVSGGIIRSILETYDLSNILTVYYDYKTSMTTGQSNCSSNWWPTYTINYFTVYGKTEGLCYCLPSLLITFWKSVSIIELTCRSDATKHRISIYVSYSSQGYI